MYLCVYIYIYIYIYLSIYLSLSLSIYIYIYTYIHTCEALQPFSRHHDGPGAPVAEPGPSSQIIVLLILFSS